MQRRRRERQLELGVVLLLFEIMQAGVHTFSPVTLGTVALQVAIYIGLIDLPWTKGEVCISSKAVIKNREWRRLIFSTVEHADDMHLYYNMGSFLLKGKMLERKYGTLNFGLLLCFLTGLTNALYVVIGHILTEVSRDLSYQSSCAIGFSGVIFALKVLTTSENLTSTQYIMGIPTPGKYAAWVELFVIHLLNPHASFMGHFAGIIAGILYSKTILGSLVDYIIYQISGIPMCHGILSYEDYTFD